MNPDPQPCPPLLPPEEALLREGLTLKPGGLAGFDMSVWESGTTGPGDESRKKVRRSNRFRSFRTILTEIALASHRLTFTFFDTLSSSTYE